MVEPIYTEEEMETFRKKYEKLITKQTEKIGFQTNRIDGLEEENRRLSEKNKIYSNALVQEKEEKRKLNERIEELEQCNLNLQTRIDNKEKVNIQLRKDIKWYEKEEDRLREENKELNEKYNGLWDIYQKDVAERVEENKQLKAEIEQLRK